MGKEGGFIDLCRRRVFVFLECRRVNEVLEGDIVRVFGVINSVGFYIFDLKLFV